MRGKQAGHDLARESRTGQSDAIERTLASTGIKRAAGLRGVAKRQHGQVVVAGDAHDGELRLEGHGRGARVLPEVDLVGRALAHPPVSATSATTWRVSDRVVSGADEAVTARHGRTGDGAAPRAHPCICTPAATGVYERVNV